MVIREEGKGHINSHFLIHKERSLKVYFAPLYLIVLPVVELIVYFIFIMEVIRILVFFVAELLSLEFMIPFVSFMLRQGYGRRYCWKGD